MLTATQTDLMQLSQTTRLPVVSAYAVKLAYLTLIWSERRRTRRELSEIPLTRLDDIGLTFDQARTEARKWFWRA
jgi:uncharacterized protein YjiS (DUF1127 family)